MQSEYGGVSEIQRFMVDPSLFTISTTTPTSTDIHTTTASQLHKYHQHQHHHHHQHHPQHQPQPQPQQQQQQPDQPRFPHFHSFPITQQLFQQTHQFQLFKQHEHQRRLQHHQLGLDQDRSGPENSISSSPMMGAAGGGPSFLASAINFKLAVNDSNIGGLNNEEGGLHGDDDGSESRVHQWQREEESAIKEPFWRPLDIDYINRNNKRYNEKQLEIPNNKYYKNSNKEASDDEQGNNSASNYKLFSELEAIYKPGGSTNGGGGPRGNNQTGSGSALTGENPIMTTTAFAEPTSVDHGSETSAGEEAPTKNFQKNKNNRKKRKSKQEMSSIASFFETLVKQLIDHQEGLHRKFLEVMERRDHERTIREEAWRQQEADKSSREAAAKAQEQALTSTREAAIISFLEKITGESLNLPTKSQLEYQLVEEAQKEDNTKSNQMELSDAFNNYNNADNNNNKIQLNASRWPKAEVQSLIQVRSNLESRFQEPGLKGPLWEEVSSAMATMGYYRSAKRCKEKWENINKYFRKTKDSAKKRPHHSKTCPYFHQLDQLYSKPLDKPPPTLTNLENTTNASAEHWRENSELLDAVVVPTTDHTSFKFLEMGSLIKLDHNGKDDENNVAGKGLGRRGAHNVEQDNSEEEEDEAEDEQEGEEEEEGEGESQDHVQDQEGLHRETHHIQHHHHLHDSTLFF